MMMMMMMMSRLPYDASSHMLASKIIPCAFTATTLPVRLPFEEKGSEDLCACVCLEGTLFTLVSRGGSCASRAALLSLSWCSQARTLGRRGLFGHVPTWLGFCVTFRSDHSQSEHLRSRRFFRLGQLFLLGAPLPEPHLPNFGFGTERETGVALEILVENPR